MDYGWTAIGTYSCTYVGTLGMIYAAISSGLVGGGDVLYWIESIGLKEYLPHDLSPTSSNLVVSWVATELLEPIRIAFTLAITPTMARWMGVRPKEALKEAVNIAKTEKKEDKTKQ